MMRTQMGRRRAAMAVASMLFSISSSSSSSEGPSNVPMSSVGATVAAQPPLQPSYQRPFQLDHDGARFRTAAPFPHHGAGRFLHFTDMHPDKYYAPGARVNDACHTVADQAEDAGEDEERESAGDEVSGVGSAYDGEGRTAVPLKKGKKKKKKQARAGYWGAPNSVCDSPEHLVEATLDWLAREWNHPDTNRSGFDFIIWTGDTARHDIDFMHPRKAEEIFDYNRRILALVEKRFPATPIVPSIGNNDIIPHNIMFPGPNSMTRAYLDTWSNHIPANQRQDFIDGGYFAQEVIPGDLAVISLNTLYWYDANAATRGCKKRSEPGSIHLDWLAEQLAAVRARGMQAHLIGHVPPTAGNYFPACYSRYTDIALRYQDTIVGQHFGHMNIDAWFLQEDDLLASESEPVSKDYDVAGGATQRQRVIGSRRSVQRPDWHQMALEEDLRKEYDLVPTRQKTNLDAYLPFFVAPSVVPTYRPTVRVWTYNTTRPTERNATPLPKKVHRQGGYRNESREATVDMSTYLDEAVARIALESAGTDYVGPLQPLQRSHRRPRRGKKGRKHHQSPHVSPDSPSRKNQYLSMLGYSQWVLDLDWHNKEHVKRSRSGKNKLACVGGDGEGEAEVINYQLEYTTYDKDTLWSPYVEGPWHNHAHQPVPKHLLEREIKLRKTKEPRQSRAWRSWLGQFVRHHLVGGFSRHGSEDDNVHVSKQRHIWVPKALRPLTDYGLPSMTVDHVLEWARELAGDDALWTRFVRRVYAESGSES